MSFPMSFQTFRFQGWKRQGGGEQKTPWTFRSQKSCRTRNKKSIYLFGVFFCTPEKPAEVGRCRRLGWDNVAFSNQPALLVCPPRFSWSSHSHTRAHTLSVEQRDFRCGHRNVSSDENVLWLLKKGQWGVVADHVTSEGEKEQEQRPVWDVRWGDGSLFNGMR